MRIELTSELDLVCHKDPNVEHPVWIKLTSKICEIRLLNHYSITKSWQFTKLNLAWHKALKVEHPVKIEFTPKVCEIVNCYSNSKP